MQAFKVKAGKHAVRLPNGKLRVWKKDEVVKSDSDLCDLFPEKFEKVNEAELPGTAAVKRAMEAREAVRKKRSNIVTSEDEDAKPAAVVDESEEDLPPEPADADSNEEEKPDLGSDVTRKFDAVAADGRLTVHYDGDNFAVAEDGVQVGGPFDGKAGVVEFFKKWKKANPK